MKALNDFAENEISERNKSQGIGTEVKQNLQSQIDNLLTLATKGFISPDEYQSKRKDLQNELDKVVEVQADQDLRTKQWYEVIGNALKLFTNVKEGFGVADLNTKREILLAIGKNPVLMDQRLLLEANEWLIPIKENARNLRYELDEVRTAPVQIREAVREQVCSTWLSIQVRNPV